MARILVIDDEAPVRRAIRRILEQAHHTVDEAEEGNAGIRLHAVLPYDLIITDIYMPDCDGLELIANLRRTDRAVKILVVSGGDEASMPDMRRDAERFGATRSLQKPFTLQELRDAVAALLGEAPPA